MVLYNITFVIEYEINNVWPAWINENFIPGALASGLVASCRFLKVIDSPNEGVTYCLQLILDDMGMHQRFQESHYTPLMAQLSRKFSTGFVSFSTLMEFIDK